MKAKKQFGQNFLNSPGALQAIVECSHILQSDTILEIGPGRGALTQKLLETGACVVAIEKDPDLIPILQEKFKAFNNFTLIHQDILEYNVSRETSIDFKIIGNIPYYITGQILRKFIDEGEAKSMTLLVQKEVADRICKRAEEKDKESLISLAVQSYGVPKYIKTVPRGSFSPAPNVDSAIIYIEKYSTEDNTGNFSQSIPPSDRTASLSWVLSRNTLAEISSKKLFFDLIHAGFSHKRKYCISNLTERFQNINFGEIFTKLNINSKIRSEDLTFDTWVQITNCVKDCGYTS